MDLDWLRVGVFAGLIFYHEGLLYEPGHPGVSLTLLFTHPWRMSILFLISGAATRFMAEGFSARRLSFERTLRLLPPLGFAILVLVPAQAYLTLIETTAYTGGFVHFLRAYVSAPERAQITRNFNYIVPVYGHLWFVFYLWIYTVVLSLGLHWAPGWFKRTQAGLERVLSGPSLLIWPFAIFTVARLSLYPVFGVNLGFLNDWYNHVTSACVFLFGFLIARSDKIWDELVKMRWAGLVMAVAGFAAYAPFVWHWGQGSDFAETQHPGMGVFYDLERWGAIVALLGFGHKHLARHTQGKGAVALKYLNGGIFTAYIVHEPAMLIMKHWLRPLQLNLAVEMTLVALGTTDACFVAYELARRVNWLGVALGQRRIGWLQFPARRPGALAAGSSPA